MTPYLACAKRATVAAAISACLATGSAFAEAPDCAGKAPEDVATFLNKSVGLPVYDHGQVGGEDLFMHCFERFCFEFNNITRTPLWVVEHMDENIAKKNFTRKQAKGKWNHDDAQAFAQDNDTKVAPVDDNAYKGATYSRGHLAASADFACFDEWMRETYTFSNAVPQWQNSFNSGVWSSLERNLHELALTGEDVFAITGPVYAPANGDEIIIEKAENGCNNEIVLRREPTLPKREICDANDKMPNARCPEDEGVAVPIGMFKIVHTPSDGRTFAHLMANLSHKERKKGFVSTNDYLRTQQVSINVIEELTGLEFFAGISRRDANVKKSHCTEQRFR